MSIPSTYFFSNLLGGAFGLVLGLAGIRELLAINPGNIPRIGRNGSAVGLDWRVLVFALAVSILTGVIFGLVPALQASSPDLSSVLKQGSRRSGGARRQAKARAVLVASEMALALLLLIGAGLLIRTFVALRTVDPGFDAHNVLTLRMSLTGTRFAHTSAVTQVVRNATEQLDALPGVEAAAASCCVPLQTVLYLPFNIVGRPHSHGPYTGVASYTPVSPGYFHAFRIPVIRGRAFAERDDASASGVVIVNEAMAKRYWPTGDPLHNQIEIGKGLGPQFADVPRRVIGVVGNVRDAGLSQDPQPIMYLPSAQINDAVGAGILGTLPLAWIVRTRMGPETAERAIAATLERASGGLPVSSVRTMDDVMMQSTARSTFETWVLAIFAAAALLLAAIGIYGLTAYSVQQQKQEIGIRLALGADGSRVRNMLVYRGMSIALAGVGIGLAAAFGLTRVIASFLFGVTPRDASVFVLVPILLSFVAFAGVWFPARRAARVDPVVALREE